MFREACGIADEENSQFYVTGGVFTERKVSLYGTDGYKRDLPDLNHGRYNHGCAGFHRNNNLVILILMLIIVIHRIPQVLMVAGGGKYRVNYQRTTEIFEVGRSSQWKEVASTPRKTYVRVEGATIDNTVFMIGRTHDPYGGYFEEWSRRVVIVKYDPEEDKWERVHQMTTYREEPTATSLLITSGFMEYCQFA